MSKNREPFIDYAKLFIIILIFLTTILWGIFSFAEEKQKTIGGAKFVSEGGYIAPLYSLGINDLKNDFGFQIGYSRLLQKDSLLFFWKLGGDLKWTAILGTPEAPVGFTPSLHGEFGFIFGSFIPSLKVRLGIDDVFKVYGGEFAMEVDYSVGLSGILWSNTKGDAITIGSYIGAKWNSGESWSAIVEPIVLTYYF